MFPSNWNCSLSIRWCPPRQCLALQFWHWQNCKYPLVQRRMLRSIVGWVRTTNNGKIRCEKWKVDWNLINLRWRCILFVSGQIVFFSPVASLNLQFMWHNTCQLGQPELFYGILPQIEANILTPNQVANKDDQHNGGTTILLNLPRDNLEINRVFFEYTWKIYVEFCRSPLNYYFRVVFPCPFLTVVSLHWLAVPPAEPHAAPAADSPGPTAMHSWWLR